MSPKQSTKPIEKDSPIIVDTGIPQLGELSLAQQKIITDVVSALIANNTKTTVATVDILPDQAQLSYSVYIDTTNRGYSIENGAHNGSSRRDDAIYAKYIFDQKTFEIKGLTNVKRHSLYQGGKEFNDYASNIFYLKNGKLVDSKDGIALDSLYYLNLARLIQILSNKEGVFVDPISGLLHDKEMKLIPININGRLITAVNFLEKIEILGIECRKVTIRYHISPNQEVNGTAYISNGKLLKVYFDTAPKEYANESIRNEITAIDSKAVIYKDVPYWGAYALIEGSTTRVYIDANRKVLTIKNRLVSKIEDNTATLYSE